MGDDLTLAEIFHAKRLASQEKRTENREKSTALLTKEGLFFTTHNGGAHLIVDERWDFWPGTGKWCERRGRKGFPKREGRGVLRLLDLIKEETCAP